MREEYLQGADDTLITVEKWTQKCGAYHAELDEMNWSWWQLFGIMIFEYTLILYQSH